MAKDVYLRSMLTFDISTYNKQLIYMGLQSKYLNHNVQMMERSSHIIVIVK